MRYYREPFTSAETAALSRFFTNTEGPVFAMVNMPEVVKGALFARYSRSSKSIRRLFLDEFVADADTGIQAMATQLGGDDPAVDLRNAERLYQKVFFEYGDDSVAQLGGAHLACEQASNVLTKALEWGRLAAYLEQSTRYIYYDAKLGGQYRYGVPPEIEDDALRSDYVSFMERLFDSYARIVAAMTTGYQKKYPKQPNDSPGVYAATIRAKACDAARGLLPASTLSNVGVYASGQAYEMALMRMNAHPLGEVRAYGAMMLTELRAVIPSFLTRVDRPDRGLEWSRYLADNSARLGALAAALEETPQRSASVTLTDFDTDAELKLTAAALYAVSELPDAQLVDVARRMTESERAEVIRALVGNRGNRRHKPGRPMERISYRFDVVCDFGAFRDLQRHRMMSLEWQNLSTRLGYDVPPDIADAGFGSEWDEIMGEAGALYERTRSQVGIDVAQYVVPFSFNIRFVMEMNAREAFHLIELRSQPAGHITYRRVAHEMHRQIRDVAGHRLIADGMTFVDHSDVGLERLESERKAEERRLRADV